MNRRAVALLLAPVLGLLAMVLPVILRRPARWYDAPLFPLLRNAVEHVGFRQLLLLFLAGVVLGLIAPGGALRLGGAAILFLPLAAIAEMFADPTSHNLWPFEFVIYAFYGLLVAAGATIVHRLRSRRLGAART